MKWFKRILLTLLTLAILAVATIHFSGGAIIQRQYTAEPRNVILSSRPEIIQHGQRMAQVFGCFYGCHGDDMEGEVFFEGLLIGKIISPDLTRAMEIYSASELEAIIRQGIKPDGTSVIGMPSASFATMTDRDLSAILSFIDQYPQQESELGYSKIGLLPRFMLATGQFEPSAAEVKGEPVPSSELQDSLVLGRYLAMNACSECHGMDLAGHEGSIPPLTMAQGYSPEQFIRLLTSGVTPDERDIGLMGVVAESRFRKMTEQEMLALHQYLGTL
jgi:mono/diheme cytochrome c family protein